ncbi:uncharacterized protein LOC125029576 [Penaeus chinensis]|uniref:uncharacterized protein LOC125029576 n=1 Tax=Penaeus chinensis TaxID=139456 RepID=UPI001FB65D5B|nr:uncharacterized protein LOC125029576 [Penaeus chinensis]
MGAKCCKDSHAASDDVDDSVKPVPNGTAFGVDSGPSAVVQWEERQRELNFLVLEKMREEFHDRPDNFILNLLVVSLQFYKNYGKDKAEISNHIRDREQALSQKMTLSKRKIMYMGGFEEISGTHALFLPKGENYMELPSPLQVYVVHDNVEVYPDDQYEELQRRNYADLDGPAYRFCVEYSKRHIGYVRLRCADIIPGVSRNNTYEDIYAFMPPVDETKPDPVVDMRPLRRSSVVSPDEDDIPPTRQEARPFLQHVSSIEEGDEDEETREDKESEKDDDDEEEEDSFDGEPMRPPMHLLGRRPSGVMPLNYPTGRLSKQNPPKRPNGIIKTGILTKKAPPNPKPGPRLLTERRPSGVFPKMNPNMDRLKITSEQHRKLQSSGDNFNALKRILAGIEEGSEEEEDDSQSEKDSLSDVKAHQEDPTIDDIPDKGAEESAEEKPKEEVRLHASINTGCFMNCKIRLRVENDAYGIKARSELRTYFSSERYMECFEEDFDTLAKIMGKEHLVDSSQVQMPAILASELMIDGIGPKFNTEFIPTILHKEWPRCAFEWKLRDRKPRADPATKTLYRWPKYSTINEVVNTGCNLVPIGHYRPSQPNVVMKMEWQIQFNRAEQILLRSLGHSQIRLLLLVEFLLRDHLQEIPGLKTQHLRFILYWMCEHNFRDWQEERLGNKLKAYFKTLYNCLSTEHLPHYFIDKCNMLETIPERYLRQVQALVKNMKDNLPIYMMHTMLRIRTEEDFYPILDVRELYKLLLPKTFSIGQINPGLLGLTDDDALDEMGEDGVSSGKIKKLDEGDDVLYSDSEEERAHQDMKEQLHALRQQRKLAAQRSSKDDQRKKRRRSTINLKAKIHSVKDLRAGKVLSLFAKHFIGMARASNKYRAYPQAYMYLLLAGNMATLMEETGNGQEAEVFNREIEELNVASRGGVKDMLGSSWGMTDTHDLMLGNPNIRGSNWELKKEQQPLPSPPMRASPVSGLKLTKKNLGGLVDNLNELQQANKVRVTESKSNDSLSDAMLQMRERTQSATNNPNALHDPSAIVVFSDEDEEEASTDL